jgi:TetR/AcrR family transcriptional repressor of nem operon
MRDLGLTHGGFYVHFGSRDALDAAAFEHAMAEQARLDADIPPGTPTRVARVARAGRYLSRGHRDKPEAGCAIAALLGEAARGGNELRAAFGAAVVDAVARRAPAGSRHDEDEEFALLALAAGGLALARSVPDAAMSDRILKACRAAVVRLAEPLEGDAR